MSHIRVQLWQTKVRQVLVEPRVVDAVGVEGKEVFCKIIVHKLSTHCCGYSDTRNITHAVAR